MTRAARGSRAQKRCTWPGEDPLYVSYHDEEWGVPEHDDRALYEKLILDGFQAGLAWITILRKREGFRRAFDHFDPEKIARYGARQRSSLMRDASIVRNRMKIDATVTNARAYLELRDAGESFSDYLWQFVNGRTLHGQWQSWKRIPAETRESRAMSKGLKARGFRFCGPTICYAFMQAVGMVNDHVVSCFRYRQLGGRRRPSRRR